MKVNEFMKIRTAVFMLLLTLSCNNETVEPQTTDETADATDCSCSAAANAAVMQVGANRPFKTVKEAAAVARNNTVIEIDAGTYRGEVVYWTQDSVVIRAVGGEVILDAAGVSMQKGIWEIGGGAFCIEGITFINAKVSDRNGAGIRLTDGKLTVINCRFLHNETGILTANNGNTTTLTVQNCEFGYNGYGDGYSHNLYAGYIAALHVTGSHFHHAKIGHLIKSRAALNRIYYNLIADGNDADSRASYEIDIPSGGQAVIVGNIIQKSSTPDNPNVISFAKESSSHYPENRIYICYNTILNNHNANDKVLTAPASGVEKYVFNNAIQENTKFDTGIPLTAEKGNVFFKTNELSACYPVSAVMESWKSKHEKSIDDYLPQSLKLESVSLVPRYQYSPPQNIMPINGDPSISGAVQTPYPSPAQPLIPD
jgi:hypothetical protein